MAISRKNIILQDASTSSSIGEVLEVEDFDTFVFEISGTATASQIFFEAQAVAGGSFLPIACLKSTDYSLASSTTTKNENWQVDIGGFHSFRTRIGSISGGNITIKGRASSIK